MILFIPTFEVRLAAPAVGVNQARNITPKLRVALQIKTTDFHIPESPNPHGHALL
jgi:hypothetical protein